MRIREATVDDVPVIVEMAQAFMVEGAYHRWLNPQPQQLVAFVGTVLDLGVIFLAELEPSDPGWTPSPPADVVGMIAGVALPHPLGGERYVDEVAWWVYTEHRGTEAGRKLLSRLEQWTLDIGAKYLRMVAPAGSHLGTLYERRGYVEVERAFHRLV